MIYLINKDEVELATPYQLDDNGELRETTWAANAYLGPDVGPDGTKLNSLCEYLYRRTVNLKLNSKTNCYYNTPQNFKSFLYFLTYSKDSAPVL